MFVIPNSITETVWVTPQKTLNVLFTYISLQQNSYVASLVFLKFFILFLNYVLVRVYSLWLENNILYIAFPTIFLVPPTGTIYNYYNTIDYTFLTSPWIFYNYQFVSLVCLHISLMISIIKKYSEYIFMVTTGLKVFW